MSRDLSQYGDRIYMAALEKELNRGRSTIRTWERMGWLPDELAFHRDEAGWRFWDKKQLKLAKKWLSQRDPGRSQPRRRAA